MSKDRGVTHPGQQGQNLDRRRDFFEDQFYGYGYIWYWDSWRMEMYTLVIMGFQNHLPNLWYLRTRSGITCISCFKEDSEKLRCSSYLIKQQPFDIKFLVVILRRNSTHIVFNLKLHDNRWLELWSFCLWKPGEVETIGSKNRRKKWQKSV